jgi:hypothetical protein
LRCRSWGSPHDIAGSGTDRDRIGHLRCSVSRWCPTDSLNSFTFRVFSHEFRFQSDFSNCSLTFRNCLSYVISASNILIVCDPLPTETGGYSLLKLD